MAVRLCETCKKKGLYRCFLGLDGTCESYEKKVMTNFERIKVMDIEEMANMMLMLGDCEKYCAFTKDGSCDAHSHEIQECKNGVKQWLESEVTE